MVTKPKGNTSLLNNKTNQSQRQKELYKTLSEQNEYKFEEQTYHLSSNCFFRFRRARVWTPGEYCFVDFDPINEAKEPSFSLNEEKSRD